jgi:Ca2+-binding RTX toxin-like protein
MKRSLPLVVLVVLGQLLNAPPASAAVSSSVVHHALTITGDAGADTVDVTCVNGNVKVNGVNPDTGTATCASLTNLSVATLAGNDVIDLSGVTRAAFMNLFEPGVYSGPDDDDITAAHVGTFADGQAGDDTLTGLGGDDRLQGDDGLDTLNGGGGYDIVGGWVHGPATLTNSLLVSDDGSTSLTGFEASTLTVGGPTYDGSAFTGRQVVRVGVDSTVTTGNANDTISWSSGNVTAYTGGGVNSVEVQTTTGVELAPGTATKGGDTLTFAGVTRAKIRWLSFALAGGTVDARTWTKPLRFLNESSHRVTFLGGLGADRATGGPRADILKGFRGNDVLLGRKGADTIVGGLGFDTCRGGPGADIVTGCEA